MPEWRDDILKRLSTLRLSPAREAEIVDELAQHLEDRFRELVAGGAVEKEARHIALDELSDERLLVRELRSVEQEAAQDPVVPGGGGGKNLMASLWQDIRYGLRMLAKHPGFTAVAVISLGLGIGVNTTIFSFINALLFRPPDVSAPAELVEVWNENRRGSGLERFMVLSYPDYLFYRDHNQVFSGLMAFDGDPHILSWSRSGMGERVQGALVSGNFFTVLGIKLALGRTFQPEEDQTPGAHPVVVLSHAFWEDRLGADPHVIDKTLIFNGTTFGVVGVAPPGFKGVLVGMQPDFWAPLAMTLAFTHDPHYLEDRQAFWLFAAGRLKPGVKIPQARADLKVLSLQLQQAFPKSNKELEATTSSLTLVPGPFRGYVAAFTGLLMAVVGLVLLIACANAANLLLAQATARQREMAIRTALGASRARLMRQTLIESTLVALLGGAVAFLLASALTPALLGLKPPSLPLKLDVPLDWRVLGFTLAVSLATGIIFGIAPALRGAKLDVSHSLKDETPIGARRKSRWRSTLVVAQVALCLVLLISAGLCVRSLLNARSIDPGFDTQHVIMAELDPGALGYTETKGKEYYEELVRRVSALPGVTSASLADCLPLTTEHSMRGISPEDRPTPAKEAPSISTTSVAPDYFRTMGIPLLRGRAFDDHDTSGTPGVIVINEALAKRFWPNADPIGKRVVLRGSPNKDRLEVVGVVPTGKYRTLGEHPLPFFYTAILQSYQSRATLVVRAAGDPHPLLAEVRRAIQAIDPNVVPLDLETMKEYMALPLFPARTTGLLLGAFGVLGLLLAVVGLYGVVAYVASQRTHEIGVRVALGASRHDVMKLVVGQGLGLTLEGIGIGLLGAFAATRALASLLYGISPTDPVTFVLVPSVLVAVSLAASYLPARRATKVDPMVALRYE